MMLSSPYSVHRSSDTWKRARFRSVFEAAMAMKHPKLGALANEFTSTFAMFEYALKERGHYKFTNGAFPKIESLWTAFAAANPKAAEHSFFNKLKAADETRYVIDEPPKHRTEVDDGHGGKKLDWQSAQPVNNMCDLYYAVKRVRNNLFHGDKSEWMKTRDPKLLRSCLAVIGAILEQAPDVKAAFEAGTALFAIQDDN